MCQAWSWVLETCGPRGLLGTENDGGSGGGGSPSSTRADTEGKPGVGVCGMHVHACVCACMHVCMSSPVHSAKVNALPGDGKRDPGRTGCGVAMGVRGMLLPVSHFPF